MIRVLWAALALCAAAAAQPVYVYSEFAQIDAKGNVVQPDHPREILSPAIARNAFNSFQVVVQTDSEKPWWLHIGQNPENAVTVTMYRETGDKLEKVDLPVRGTGTQVFWMDLWTERAAPVERIKVEPQLNIDDDWVIYPMEARVMDAVIPDHQNRGPMSTAPQQMRALICPEPRSGAIVGASLSSSSTVALLRSRNAQQDVALAAQAPRGDLQKLVGPCTAAPSPNPESYFPIRDYLLRMR